MWMTVSTKASGAAATALARGWDEKVDGPRPDVWSPASSSWAVLVDQGSTDLDRPSPMPKERPSLVQTPLVIAMPLPMAQALGWPDAQIGWKDLAAVAKSPKGWASKDHPEWGRFKLGKTNPYFSTSGLNATIASYFAATGVSSDLTSEQVADPETRAFVKQLESSVVHYGDTTLTFLENMSREAAAGQGLTYVSAVTVEEKSVLDYNLGNPTGDPATLGQQPPPTVPLAAVYPSDGTLLSDNPWIALDAEWVDDAKRQAATDFLGWLHEPEQQKAFTDAGFRTFEGEPGARHHAGQRDAARRAGQHHLPALPGRAGRRPEVLGRAAQARARAVRDGRVRVDGRAGHLVGPDEAEAGPGRGHLGVRRLREGRRGRPLAVLDRARARTSSPGWRWSRSARPARRSRRCRPTWPPWSPTGGRPSTPHCARPRQRMLADLDTKRINAIVLLSDGMNEYPPDNDLDSLVEQLQGESVDTSVRVFPIGYGEGADPESLGAIAEASRGKYYEANDPASIEKVLASVLSNF